MSWRDRNPDDDVFTPRHEDDLAAEQAQAEALADRLADHTPVLTFTAPLSSVRRGEARPPIPAGVSGPDAKTHTPALASGPPSPSGRAT